MALSDDKTTYDILVKPFLLFAGDFRLLCLQGSLQVLSFRFPFRDIYRKDLRCIAVTTFSNTVILL